MSYYIIAHASKFVPQNSVRIASTQPGNLATVAFKREDGKLVLIVENDGNNAESFNIRINGKIATLSLEAGAKKAIIYHFEQNSFGIKKVNYKLRDWGVSRQRYWGAPIPFIHCEKCGLVPEKIENLPVALPEDVEITGEGNPLDTHPTWKHCTCPKCGEKATRETDTLDTFVQSSW